MHKLEIFNQTLSNHANAISLGWCHGYNLTEILTLSSSYIITVTISNLWSRKNPVHGNAYCQAQRSWLALILVYYRPPPPTATWSSLKMAVFFIDLTFEVPK